MIIKQRETRLMSKLESLTFLKQFWILWTPVYWFYLLCAKLSFFFAKIYCKKCPISKVKLYKNHNWKTVTNIWRGRRGVYGFRKPTITDGSFVKSRSLRKNIHKVLEGQTCIIFICSYSHKMFFAPPPPLKKIPWDKKTNSRKNIEHFLNFFVQ